MSNTIIIFSSDHGESFSHNKQAHGGPHLYEPLVRIPLIVKMPGQQKGRKIEIPVSQSDIAPTILELAGIPVPAWMEGRPLNPLFEGGSLESRPVFSMQLIKNRAIGNNPITKGTIAVWEGDYKLVYYLEKEKTVLFNLHDDPGERRNIFHERPEIGGDLMKSLKDTMDLANASIVKSVEEKAGH